MGCTCEDCSGVSYKVWFVCVASQQVTSCSDTSSVGGVTANYHPGKGCQVVDPGVMSWVMMRLWCHCSMWGPVRSHSAKIAVISETGWRSTCSPYSPHWASHLDCCLSCCANASNRCGGPLILLLSVLCCKEQDATPVCLFYVISQLVWPFFCNSNNISSHVARHIHCGGDFSWQVSLVKCALLKKLIGETLPDAGYECVSSRHLFPFLT